VLLPRRKRHQFPPKGLNGLPGIYSLNCNSEAILFNSQEGTIIFLRNIDKIIDFTLSLWLITCVDSVPGILQLADVGGAADISEAHGTPYFKVDSEDGGSMYL
jgi:hypothetical protein